MLSFDDLGAGDWRKYADSILQSENVFPDSIRTPQEDFLEIVGESDGIAKVALLDSQYLGNVFGYRISPDDFEYYGLHDVPKDAKVIYLFSIVVNPEFQGRGYGRQLIWEFIVAAKAKGYDFIAGHFRQNGSLKLIKAFGAKEEGVYQNWENTNEDCVACCLDINSISESDFKGPSVPNNGLLPVTNTQPPEQPKREDAVKPPAVPEMPDNHPIEMEPHLQDPCLSVPAPTL